MHAFRTDLAIESGALHTGGAVKDVKSETYERFGVTVQRVDILSEDGAERVGKPQGRYFTFELPPLGTLADAGDNAVHAIAQALSDLLPKEGLALIAGLGNSSITPDALGPKTVVSVLATRHIPESVAKESGLAHLRPVAAIAPGVLGQTGIEVSEIIRSIVADIRPACVIAVDALASRSLGRLGCTIQLSDTGISPGSGVLNRRKELSRETLGVPVISLGIPTVVDAATLALELTAKGESTGMDDAARTMMVTPRDVDTLIAQGAKILSLAINKALQPSLPLEELSFLVS